MHIIQTILPKSQIELKFTLTPVDYEPYLRKAAEEISRQQIFPGFRPGKVPFEIVKKQIGALALLQRAVEILIPKTVVQAITERNIKSIGQSDVRIEKIAPENELAFSSTVSLVPEVSLANWREIFVEPKPIVIDEKQIDNVIHNIRASCAKEARVSRPSQKSDKIIIDMDISLAGAPVDGGQAKNHQVYLDEEHFIPGFPEQLLELSENEEKSFSLPFPKNHYQKHLAGKQADFKIKVKGVFERELPPEDDVLAEQVGQKTFVELRALIKNNLALEAKQKEQDRAEIELLEKILKASTIGELPEILIDSERQKMLAELRASIEESGMEFAKYLEQIKKTTEELGKEFTNQAQKRARLALIMRKIARQEGITCAADELEKELDSLRARYSEHPHINERIQSDDIREYASSVVATRKVMDLLRAQIKLPAL